MTTPQTQAALLSAHWYSIDKHGAATLCVDEDDAKATAIDSQTLYPHNGPYRAVQMAPIEPAQAGELPDPDAVFYCSEDTGYLTQYRLPPANLTDGDVAMYEADTVRSLLSAALAARKPLSVDEPQYRLLRSDVDQIETNDEFLSEDTKTWAIDPNGIFVGMVYGGRVLRPARRRINGLEVKK